MITRFRFTILLSRLRTLALVSVSFFSFARMEASKAKTLHLDTIRAVNSIEIRRQQEMNSPIRRFMAFLIKILAKTAGGATEDDSASRALRDSIRLLMFP